MMSAGFLLRKWPKRHEHLVEECVAGRRVLHVADVLPDLRRHWQERPKGVSGSFGQATVPGDALIHAGGI